jgi:hypothetical protein
MVDTKEFVKPETRQVKLNRKTKDRVVNLVGGLIMLVIVVSIYGVLVGIRAVADWGGTHEIIGQRIADLEVRWPFRVEDRKPLEVISPLGKAILETIDEPLSGVQTTVMEKFGAVEFKVVDAIIKCESNYNPEAINYNSNRTFDAGLFQINQIHWNSEYCPFGLKDLLEPGNNIECAYQIYLRHGKSFEAWSSISNGCVADRL